MSSIKWQPVSKSTRGRSVEYFANVSFFPHYDVGVNSLAQMRVERVHLNLEEQRTSSLREDRYRLTYQFTSGSNKKSMPVPRDGIARVELYKIVFTSELEVELGAAQNDEDREAVFVRHACTIFACTRSFTSLITSHYRDSTLDISPDHPVFHAIVSYIPLTGDVASVRAAFFQIARLSITFNDAMALLPALYRPLNSLALLFSNWRDATRRIFIPRASARAVPNSRIAGTPPRASASAPVDSYVVSATLEAPTVPAPKTKTPMRSVLVMIYRLTLDFYNERPELDAPHQPATVTVGDGKFEPMPLTSTPQTSAPGSIVVSEDETLYTLGDQAPQPHFDSSANLNSELLISNLHDAQVEVPPSAEVGAETGPTPTRKPDVSWSSSPLTLHVVPKTRKVPTGDPNALAKLVHSCLVTFDTIQLEKPIEGVTARGRVTVRLQKKLVTQYVAVSNKSAAPAHAQPITTTEKVDTATSTSTTDDGAAPRDESDESDESYEPVSLAESSTWSARSQRYTETGADYMLDDVDACCDWTDIVSSTVEPYDFSPKLSRIRGWLGANGMMLGVNDRFWTVKVWPYAYLHQPPTLQPSVHPVPGSSNNASATSPPSSTALAQEDGSDEDYGEDESDAATSNDETWLVGITKLHITVASPYILTACEQERPLFSASTYQAYV